MVLPYKYFYDPFANAGNRSTIPDTVQVDGTVSWPQGYGPDYSLDAGSDPDALLIGRTQYNESLYQITLALAAIQTDFPQFVSDADNGGVPFGYNRGAVVRFTDGALWVSLVNTNTATPGTDATKWVIFLSQYALQSALAAEIARAEAAEALLAPINNPIFTGNPQAPTRAPNTTGEFIATCNYVIGAVAAETARAEAAEAALAPINSPGFTGTPTAPTPAPGDSTTRLATTGFVTPAIAAALAAAIAAVAVETARAEAAEALLAPINSPGFTGNPTAATQAPGNNSTRLSNTAFVTAAVAVETARAVAVEATLAPLDSPGFSGVPTAPTPPDISNDFTIPNTSWVKSLLSTIMAPSVPGYFRAGQFIIQWVIGPYETSGQGFRNLSWAIPFPTACLVAVASADLVSPSDNADVWYQTAGWNTTRVVVQRQRNDNYTTRAVVWAIGY